MARKNGEGNSKAAEEDKLMHSFKKLAFLPWLILALILGTPAFAQGPVPTVGAPNPKTFSTAPTGTCGPQDTAVNTTTGDFYSCNNGAWLKVNGGGGGGSGTVSSGTAGQVTYCGANGTTVSGNTNLTTDSSGDIFVKGGDPSYDALAFSGVDRTGATDSATGLQNWANSCGSSGGRLTLPAGTYALKSGSGIVVSGSNCQIVADPKATIQAQTGFSVSGCMLALPSSGRTVVSGGVWDGNSIALEIFCGPIANAGGAYIWLDNFEAKNASTCIAGGANKPSGGPTLKISNFNIHDCPGNAVYIFADYYLTIKDGTAANNARGNHLNPTFGCSYCRSFEVTNVNFINNGFLPTRNGEGQLYALGIDSGKWTHNHFKDTNGSVTHCDYCNNIMMDSNQSINESGLAWYCETSSNCTISNNSSDSATHAGGVEPIVTGSGTQGIAALRTQVNALSSTTGLVASAHVTLSTTPNFPSSGITAVNAAMDASFPATGTIFYQNVTPVQNVPGWWAIWISASTQGSDGDFSLVLSNSSNLATQDVVIPIHGIGGQANRFIEYGYGWGAAFAVGTNGFTSWGILANVNKASTSITIQDLEYSGEVVNNIIVGNVAKGATSAGCMVLRDMQGGFVSHNYCYQTGGIQVNDSWPPVLIEDNQFYYSCCSINMIGVDSTGNGAGLSGVIDGGGNNVFIGKSPMGTTGFTIQPATYNLTNGGIRLSKMAGGLPTCTFTSGGGTSPSCAIQAGSTDEAGTIILTTGTGSPAATGTVTLTFSAAFGTNSPDCLWTLSQAGAGQWSFRGSILDTTPTTASDIQTFDNNGFVLSTSTAYRINYRCYAK